MLRAFFVWNGVQLVTWVNNFEAGVGELDEEGLPHGNFDEAGRVPGGVDMRQEISEVRVPEKLLQFVALTETRENVVRNFFDVFVVDDDPAGRRLFGVADRVDAEDGVGFLLLPTRLANRLFVGLEASQRAATEEQETIDVVWS